jgi:imidazolonepropionase-like amidohydrolase
MLHRVAVLGLLGLLSASSQEAGQADLILVGATVLTGDSAQASSSAIAVAGDRISAIGPGDEIRRLAGPKTRIVDLAGRSVIPGLIDAHVHLLVAPSTIVDESSLRNYERAALPKVLTGFLSHGITTVRSTADPLPNITELRDRLDRGELMGPRLVVTGPTPSSPGGHPAVTVCRNNSFCRQAVVREVENEEQARKVVRDLVLAKVNAVKVTIDNSIASVRNVPLLSDAVLAALVEDTHRSGRRIIAHVITDAATTERLAKMGFDEFVHMPVISTPSDSSRLAALLAERKMAVTTTLSIWDAYQDTSGGDRLVWGVPYNPGLRRSFDAVLATTKAFSDAGVRLVVGTDWIEDSDYARQGDVRLQDARLRPGARTLHEMELLRNRAGLSPVAVLTAATRNAAEALGIIESVGTITPGKMADLVILNGDVLQDFSALRRTVAVLKSGRVVSGALPTR